MPFPTRSTTRRLPALAVAAAALFGLPGRALAAPGAVATIAVDEVRAGMTGYGLTVFRGTRPEKFEIKVIDVLRKFLPKQDIILIESDDERLKHTGIVAGMSGSPIYLRTATGDRLAGALAYGWHFSKDPIAGVTPIAAMLAEANRPVRGRANTPAAAAENGPALREPVPVEAVARQQDSTAPRLVPATVPLSLAGFSPRVADELATLLSPYGITPMAGGGGGGKPGPGGANDDGPARFEPGDAIAVQLIRGDMSAAGTGTVTWVDGDKVLAFGHPMFNLGELYVPVATAEVHTVLAALSSSFKMASPRREVGTLVQDRQSGIVADLSQRSDMLPVRVRFGSPGGPGDTARTYNAEVLRHRFLTPLLTSSLLANVTQAAAADVSDATYTVRTRLEVKGERPLELVDHAFAAEGFSARALGGLSGLRAISDLLFNAFAPTGLERIDVQIDVEYKADVAEITSVSLGSDTLDPGSRPSLRVTLRPYGGSEYVESIPFEVPPHLAGSLVKIEVAAGNLVKPDLAAPENLHGLVENLRKGYPARALVVTVQTPDDALALRGAVLSDLPSSVLDTLRPGASTRKGETFRISQRTVVPTRGVMAGKQEIQVKVRDTSSL